MTSPGHPVAAVASQAFGLGQAACFMTGVLAWWFGMLMADTLPGDSVREREVLELFAGGRSANWIAEELVISKNTVRSHIRSIYTKLDVHTRQELLDFLKTVS